MGKKAHNSQIHSDKSTPCNFLKVVLLLVSHIVLHTENFKFILFIIKLCSLNCIFKSISEMNKHIFIFIILE